MELDDHLRWNLALELMEKEKMSHGYIHEQLKFAEDELNACRRSGRELRFPYEKRTICHMAFQQFHRDNQY